jgi:hypothetical protein
MDLVVQWLSDALAAGGRFDPIIVGKRSLAMATSLSPLLTRPMQFVGILSREVGD